MLPMPSDRVGMDNKLESRTISCWRDLQQDTNRRSCRAVSDTPKSVSAETVTLVEMSATRCSYPLCSLQECPQIPVWFYQKMPWNKNTCKNLLLLQHSDTDNTIAIHKNIFKILKILTNAKSFLLKHHLQRLFSLISNRNFKKISSLQNSIQYEHGHFKL